MRIPWVDKYRGFAPETLPAPQGRGPGGWPLSRCLLPGCSAPVPWPTHGRSPYPLAPKQYYKRKFCSVAHAYEGLSLPPALCRNRHQVAPVDFDQGDRGREFAVAFDRPFPQREDITRCTHCSGTALRDIASGRQCRICGQIMPAQDGAWLDELERVG